MSSRGQLKRSPFSSIVEYLKQMVCILATAALAVTSATASVITITPSADTTIYEGSADGDASGTSEDNSCGGGSDLYAGLTNSGFRRRALLGFDVADAIPAGSTINSVSLSMTINRTQDTEERLMNLHPVTMDWNEGAVDCSTLFGGGQGDEADIGDATWVSAANQQTSWVSAGGDFGPASASTTVSVDILIPAVWTSTNLLISDVQSWLDNPAANYGWFLLGDENSDLSGQTTRRFDSSSGPSPPQLTVDFTSPVDVFACCLGDGSCSVTEASACVSGGGIPNTGMTTCEPNLCLQPIGACCNGDETCSGSVAADVCVDGGGLFEGAGSTCAVVDCGLTPFVDPLPNPTRLHPVHEQQQGGDKFEITISQSSQRLHSELEPTYLWTYNGTFPGPTIEVESGRAIEVRVKNDLPIGTAHHLAVDECAHGPSYWQDTARTVVHLHGGHVPSRYDGQPEYGFMPGDFDVYRYPNNQLPATLWYHDHALGITRLNVYMGLAGFYIIRDDFERNLGLPQGSDEIPLLIQDRRFNSDGSLFYPDTIQDAFYGDKILVNGKVWPHRFVKQGKYRFRLLNGSQARVYDLRLENQADPNQVIPFHLIGTDGGLITSPITLESVSLAPAERLDVIVDFEDFEADTEIVLRNADAGFAAVPNVMKFIVGPNNGFRNPLPTTLRPVTAIAEAMASRTRHFRLLREEESCTGRQWLIQSFDADGNVTGQHWDDVTEFPELETTEIWEFENDTAMMHPIHVHLVMFQILDKTDITTGQLIPLEPWELNTWKDTVTVPPGSRVRIIMTFEDYVGRFAYHCHILDHEDDEMMRQFQTTSGVCDFDSLCEDGEDCASCSDCGLSSGAFCGNGLCEVGDGESCLTCPSDCAGGADFCCGGDVFCDDSRCTDSFYCRTMPRVEACCGDGLCEGQERTTCQVDCAADCSIEGNIYCPDIFKDGFEGGDWFRWASGGGL